MCKYSLINLYIYYHSHLIYCSSIKSCSLLVCIKGLSGVKLIVLFMYSGVRWGIKRDFSLSILELYALQYSTIHTYLGERCGIWCLYRGMLELQRNVERMRGCGAGAGDGGV